MRLRHGGQETVGPKNSPMPMTKARASSQPSTQTAIARPVLSKSSAWRTPTTIAASIQIAVMTKTGIVTPGRMPNTRRRPGVAANPERDVAEGRSTERPRADACREARSDHDGQSLSGRGGVGLDFLINHRIERGRADEPL